MNKEKLMVELELYKVLLSGNENSNIIKRVELGDLDEKFAYEVYSIDEGYVGGFKYIIYTPERIDEFGDINPLKIDVKNESDTFNGVMFDLVYYKKLFEINRIVESGSDELKVLSDLIKMDEYDLQDFKKSIKLNKETTIGDRVIGKTVDLGVFKNIDEVECVYEVFEINKEYGGGYGFFVWDLKGNLNTFYNYKEYVKTLREVEDIIFFEKIALETHQLVQGNYSSSGLMGSDFSDYDGKQSFFSKIINFFKGL